MLARRCVKALGGFLHFSAAVNSLPHPASILTKPWSTLPAARFPGAFPSLSQTPAYLLRGYRGMIAAAAGEADDSRAFTGTKRKMPATVGTHNGTFHADEALACFMLRMTDRYQNADIVRTRDQKVLERLDAVLDVGGVYDAEKCRFDHHQRGFDQVFGHGFGTKLSTAGLVYKHFGREIIAKEMGMAKEHPDVEKVYLAAYKYFMEAIDAIDNGVNQFATDAPPRYASNTHLSARVAHLNPDWTEEQSVEKETAQFHKAMELTGGEFLEAVTYLAKSWLPARSIVEKCLAERKEIDPSGEIIRLERFCPWKEHLAELEKEEGVEPLPKYMLYQDDTSKAWRIQAIAVAPGKFESRRALPTSWRGLRDEELSQHSGIPGCVFVHASGFIGGNKTYEGALEMARQALVLE